MFTKFIFRALWTVLCFKCLNITAGDETITLRVLEGSDVTISTGLNGIKSDAHIQWFYGSEEIKRILNSFVFRGETIIEISERFKEHLQLNRTSGALILRDISTNHTGSYTLQITTEHITYYNITVYGSSFAIINRGSRHSVSSNGPCSPVCTVKNGEYVTLSWCNNSEIISNISIRSNKALSDPYLLPIQPPDKGIYKCVATNPVSNQTTSVNIIELCNLKAEIADTSYRHISAGVSAGILLLLLLSSAGVGIWIWKKHLKQQQGG